MYFFLVEGRGPFVVRVDDFLSNNGEAVSLF